MLVEKVQNHKIRITILFQKVLLEYQKLFKEQFKVTLLYLYERITLKIYIFLKILEFERNKIYV